MTTRPQSRFYVYILNRPDGTPFYVGKGSGDRMYMHAREAQRNCQCHKCRVIRKIWRNGGDIKYAVVYRTENEADALQHEMTVIAQYGREKLTNCTHGGTGTSGRPVSATTRAAVAEANRRRIVSNKERAKKRAAALNKRHSAETKAKIRAWHTGRVRSEAFREKMRIASRGRITRDVLEKAIAANTGRTATAETREKQRRAALQRSTNPEWHEKRRVARAQEVLTPV